MNYVLIITFWKDYDFILSYFEICWIIVALSADPDRLFSSFVLNSSTTTVCYSISIVERVIVVELKFNRIKHCFLFFISLKREFYYGNQWRVSIHVNVNKGFSITIGSFFYLFNVRSFVRYWVNDIRPMTIYICSVRLESNIIINRTNEIRVTISMTLQITRFLFANSSIDYNIASYGGLLINSNLSLAPTVKTVLLEYFKFRIIKTTLIRSIDFKMYNFTWE